MMRAGAQAVMPVRRDNARPTAQGPREVVLTSTATPVPRPLPTAAMAETKPTRPAVPASSSAPARRISPREERRPVPLDPVALKLVCTRAAGLLSLVTARPADPVPLIAAAATLASSVKPEARETMILASETPPETDVAGLAINGLKLCHNVSGLGAVDTIDAAGLKPGQAVLLYCEPKGLQSEQKSGMFVSRLSSRVELVSVAGGNKVWDLPFGEARDESPSRHADSYVNYRVHFPRSISPGDYVLRLTQTDLVSNRTTSCDLPVTFVR